jgi:hypothetical protein
MGVDVTGRKESGPEEDIFRPCLIVRLGQGLDVWDGAAAGLLPSQQDGFGVFSQHAALSQHFEWSQQVALSQQAAFCWQQVAVGAWLYAKAVKVRPRESRDRASTLRFMNFS